MKKVVIVLGLLALASSCQAPLVVLVSPEADGLLPMVKDAAAKAGVQAAVEAEPAQWPTGTIGLRITSTPGWNLPVGAPPAAPLQLPKDLTAAYQIPRSLALLSGSKEGGTDVLPLLFDLWGTTVFPSPGSRLFPSSGLWSDWVGGLPAGQLEAAGSRPGFRQAALFLNSSTLVSGSTPAARWFTQKSPDNLSSFVFGMKRSPVWVPETWHFVQADFQGSYHPGTGRAFMETYRDYETQGSTGFRKFQPLNGATSALPTVAGMVLFAEFRGPATDADRLTPLVRALGSVDFQKAAEQQKWLAANLLAPEIDGEGAQARILAKQAAVFFLTSDRLPNPLLDQNLTTAIQVTFDQTPQAPAPTPVPTPKPKKK